MASGGELCCPGCRNRTSSSGIWPDHPGSGLEMPVDPMVQEMVLSQVPDEGRGREVRSDERVLSR